MKRRHLQVLVDALCALSLLAMVALTLQRKPPPAVIPEADATPRLLAKRLKKKRRRPLPPRRLALGAKH